MLSVTVIFKSILLKEITNWSLILMVEDKKRLRNFYKRNIFHLLLTAGSIFILVIFQHFLHDRGQSRTLDKSFFEVYSFIATVISLFGIYFALVQFALESKKKENTFFGINYISSIFYNSRVYGFFKSEIFFLYLMVFSFLPIIVKTFGDQIKITIPITNIIISTKITFIWNSIFLIILFTYLLGLYKSYRIILNTSIEVQFDEMKKHCFDIHKNQIKMYFNPQNINNLLSPDKSTVDYTYRKIFERISSLVEQLEESEKDYYLNYIFDGINVANFDGASKFSKGSFLKYYLELLLSNKTSIILKEKEKNVSYYYPVLEIISENFISNNQDNSMLLEDISKLLKIQKEFDSIFLWDHMLENSTNNAEYDKRLLDCFVELFPVEDIEFYLFTSISLDNIVKLSNPEGLKKVKKVFRFWMMLFEKMDMDNSKLRLKLPCNGIIEFYNDEFEMTVSYLSRISLYPYACSAYIKKNPNSRFLERFQNSLQ